jgi:hypothetical protein
MVQYENVQDEDVRYEIRFRDARGKKMAYIKEGEGRRPTQILQSLC